MTSSLNCLVLQTCRAAMSGFPSICKLGKVCGSQPSHNNRQSAVKRSLLPEACMILFVFCLAKTLRRGLLTASST